MGIIELLLIILAVGVIMWFINLIPMPGAFRALLNVVVLILLIIFILQSFHIIEPIINFPRLLRQ